MSIVVDASVALKWVVQEANTEAALALPRDHNLVAPSLWLIETANALRRKVSKGEITAAEATMAWSQLSRAPVEVSDAPDDMAAALDLAISLGHPIYDCLYLALAIRRDTHMVTADHRFHAICGRRPDIADRIRLLGS